ncbi:alpha/beta hydrolase [Rhodococcus wratislaviensis]|uniref:alpha/beta hydrolase n=1 Tax=Rhodococcus wratislaviensis TaxID=44752 RepID=UPI00364F9FFF
MARLDVEFDSGGTTCRAWLYLPPAATEPRPVIIMGHGLGGTRGMRLDAYAERFRDAGYACLVFDYRHFGDSDGDPRQLIDIGRQRADWVAAIAYVRKRTDVDTVVLWGSSFGGGHVIEVAAKTPGIAAVVAQCPFTDGFASAAVMQPLTAIKTATRGLADLLGSRMGREPIRIAAAGTPHSAALMTAPDALPGVLALITDGADTYRNDVPARVALRIPLERPGRALRRVRCPVLLCVCDDDTVAPAWATLRHARRVPEAEVNRYPFGHFDIYVGEQFERVILDQIDFLDRHVRNAAVRRSRQ